MTVQTVPFALQNASHSAAVFRQAMSAPFLSSGALSSIELLVTQQGSPNMSVILGPGRAKVAGDSVSPPSGQTWTTQAYYDVLNDAAATLTVAASNPTNPRIDLVYIQVRDSFYSGAANQAIAGVVTGTAAASPAVPATPSNSIAIATIAVGAGVTTIVNANISRVATSAILIGGIYPTATATTLAALQTAATLSNPSRVTVLSNGSEWYWNGTLFTLDNVPRVASSAARDALYVAPVAVSAGDRVYRTDTKMQQMYDGTRWRYMSAGLVPIIPTSVASGTLGAGGVVTYSAVSSVSLNGIFTAEFDNYLVIVNSVPSTGATILGKLRLAGTDASTNYDFVQLYANAAAATGSTNLAQTSAQFTSGGVTTKHYVEIAIGSPFLAVPTTFLAKAISYTSASGLYSSQNSTGHRDSTSYDGLTLLAQAGTFTGTVRVYGYNNN